MVHVYVGFSLPGAYSKARGGRDADDDDNGGVLAWFNVAKPRSQKGDDRLSLSNAVAKSTIRLRGKKRAVKGEKNKAVRRVEET